MEELFQHSISPVFHSYIKLHNDLFIRSKGNDNELWVFIWKCFIIKRKEEKENPKVNVGEFLYAIYT